MFKTIQIHFKHTIEMYANNNENVEKNKINLIIID